MYVHRDYTLFARKRKHTLCGTFTFRNTHTYTTNEKTMKLKNLSTALIMAAMVAYTMAAQAVTIDLVLVGNPGNVADITGFGSVDHYYKIGKYEITAGQYTEFLNAVAAMSDPYELYNTSMWYNIYGCQIQRSGSGTVSDPFMYSVASDWANRPVDYVSWGDAARFTNWLHNGQPTGAQDPSTTEDGAYYLNGVTTGAQLRAVIREADAQYWIPSEDEWYKAAYHKNDGVTGNYFDFPTGSDSMPSRVLGYPSDPGNNATFYNLGYTIGSPYYRTEVGAHENSDSPYGTFDQGGNVFEWNEMPGTGSVRGLRGGSFSDGELAASNRHGNVPSYESANIGFRVASVPEPSSIPVLITWVICLLAYVSRRRQ